MEHLVFRETAAQEPGQGAERDLRDDEVPAPGDEFGDECGAAPGMALLIGGILRLVAS